MVLLTDFIPGINISFGDDIDHLSAFFMKKEHFCDHFLHKLGTHWVRIAKIKIFLQNCLEKSQHWPPVTEMNPVWRIC